MHVLQPADRFVHDALFYKGEDQFLESALPFISDGLNADESVMVAVDLEKIAALKSELGGASDAVRFVDIHHVGRNPARIIPIWRDFLDENPRSVRGIGEPVWPGRSEAELIECHHHEMLLNTAFAATRDRDFSLLCPYDAGALDEEVLDRVQSSHQSILYNGNRAESLDHMHSMETHTPFAGTLPEPPRGAAEIAFESGNLRTVRELVGAYGTGANLTRERIVDLELAVHEVAANSVMHGGGGGTLRVWIADNTLVCEIRDQGKFHEPLVGRIKPDVTAESGHGLWLANSVMDLVQIRSDDDGSAVRMHLRAG